MLRSPRTTHRRPWRSARRPRSPCRRRRPGRRARTPWYPSPSGTPRWRRSSRRSSSRRNRGPFQCTSRRWATARWCTAGPVDTWRTAPRRDRTRERGLRPRTDRQRSTPGSSSRRSARSRRFPRSCRTSGRSPSSWSTGLPLGRTPKARFRSDSGAGPRRRYSTRCTSRCCTAGLRARTRATWCRT